MPKHTVLSPAEKTALLTRYNLGEHQLPCISTIDPIARYYGLRKGQVVRIIRPSTSAGRYVTYRFGRVPPRVSFVSLILIAHACTLAGFACPFSWHRRRGD